MDTMGASAPAVMAPSDGCADGHAALQHRPGLDERAEWMIAAIDAAVSRQVDAVLHKPAFQALEATWRSLQILVKVVAQTRQVRLRILDLTWFDLSRDIEHAVEFDQSNLFRLIYNEEIGQAGGQPFGLIVADFAVAHRPSPGRATDDVTILRGLASIGAAAFCPIVLGAAPGLLGLRSFRDMAGLDVADAFDGLAHARWRVLRQHVDMRFIGLLLPRVLLRSAYQPDTRNRIDGFRYAEDIGLEAEGLVWGNAAYVFAIAVLRRFDQSGWFADLRGAPQDRVGGGLVTEIPAAVFDTDDHGIAAQPPLELRLSGVQEQQLAELGLVPVTGAPYGTALLLNSNASLHAPVKYDRMEATWNARISAMLQYVLCVSRFAHYLMIMMRDRVGSYAGPGDVQRQLSSWLSKYCLASEGTSDEMRARFPLRDAAVEVTEVAGRPGALACIVRIQPHFQLDSISTSFRLVTDVTGERREGLS